VLVGLNGGQFVGMYAEYVREIATASKYGKLVFFVGAGLSTLSELPQWWELVDRYYYGLFGKKKTSYTPDDYLKIPQIYYDVKGEAEYDKILEAVFNVDRNPNLIHFKLLAMNPYHIVTTNYDNLIEKTCLQRGKYFSNISTEEDVGNASSSRYILKVHGDFSHCFSGRNIVLKESDYLNYDMNSPLRSNLMKTIMSTYTIVFIGYGLNDYNINLLLNWVKFLQKDGYIKPFFIRTEHDPIERNNEIYFEKKGIRIIDSASLCDTQAMDYLARYNAVMDLLIDSRDNDSLASDIEIIEYMHSKLNRLYILNSVRKVDLKYAFNFDYHFEVNGLVYKNKNKGVEYLERFFDLKMTDIQDLPDETKSKFGEITAFFHNNNVLCMGNKADHTTKGIPLRIESPVYNNNFQQMKALINGSTTDLKHIYEKAFYLAYLGRLEESYNLYSYLISKVIDESDLWIHYFSQINRFRLYQSIKQTMRYYGYFGSTLSKGGTKPFSDEFYTKIENEMKNFDIDDVFQSMPHKFQDEYKLLAFLCDAKFLYDDTVKLFELTNKIRAEMNKGSSSFGNLTSDIDIQFRLNDNVRFLYDNCIWAINFTEFKQYVRNSIILQFEKAEYDRTRDIDDFGLFAGVAGSGFYIDYYDFVNICHTFDINHVKHIEKICEIDQFMIVDDDRIEEFVVRSSEELMQNIIGDANYLFYRFFMPQIKTMFYLLKYTKLSAAAVIQSITAILQALPEPDFDIGIRYLLIMRIAHKNGLPSEILPSLENFLIDQAEKHFDDHYQEHSTNGCFSKDFANLIHYYFKDYVSLKLSDFAQNVAKPHNNQISFLYRLSSILSIKAKNHLLGLKSISNIDELMDAYRVGDVSDFSDFEDIILDFIEQRLKKIKEDRIKGIIYGDTDSYVAQFAIRYFLGEIKSDKMKTFIGIDDEYDLFVDPEGFDYSKLKPVWLKRYSGPLLDDMSKNNVMHSNIVSILKERINNTSDKRYVDVLLKHFI
jgi:hypothetical protein